MMADTNVEAKATPLFTESSFTVTSSFRIRQLAAGDLAKNFIPLLQQLSDVGQLSPEFFQARLAQIQAHPDRELMLVVEDVATGIICGTGTLVVEPKFIHSAGLAGHLEDLVIDNGLRRKGLGRRIVQELLRFAEQAQCYKVIVDCSRDNAAFYEKCGFARKELAMACYFDQGTGAADDRSALWHQQRARQSQKLLRRLSSAGSLSLARELEPETRDGLIIRQLCKEDYHKNFFALLSQLTVVGTVTDEFFNQRLDMIAGDRNQYMIVILDQSTDRIVATGTLFVEQKLIHSAGLAGHIEDVVVDSTIRGKGLGKLVIEKLKKIAFEAGCYKVILDCLESNAPFYEKCGFHLGHSPICMAKYFRK